MTRRPAPGDPAPDFEAPTQEPGRTIRLSHLRGRWVVLYFYPKDRTRNCTIEACGFRDHQEEFRRFGAEVIGVSRDTPESHRDFAARRRLPFSLASDPDGSIARSYGSLTWYGWPRRTTFLIDPSGRVAKVFAHVRAGRHPEDVLESLRALQAAPQGGLRPPQKRPL